MPWLGIWVTFARFIASNFTGILVVLLIERSSLEAQENANQMPPLLVELDHVLIRTDPCWERVLEFLRTRPWQIILLLRWLLGGWNHLKGRLAELVELDPTTLPYSVEVVDYLTRESRNGRPILLVTSTEKKLADDVAHYLGLFAGVISGASGPDETGSGYIQAVRRGFGPDAVFDYLGRAGTGAPVWSEARTAIRVDSGRRTSAAQGAASAAGNTIQVPGGGLKPILKAIRPHQWTKNLLIFVPVIMGHRIFELATDARALVGFIAFCLAASSGYLINDLLDLNSDRRHASKHRRPMASGQVSIPQALLMLVAMLVGSLAVAATLSLPFLVMVILYLCLTLAYSCYLKRKLLVDVFCLGGLYTHRIFAGGMATGIIISPWLLAFSMFFFLSLAFVKRFTELLAQRDSQRKVSGRGYFPGDLDMIRSLGTACGCLAVLVVCLYINSPDVMENYRRAELLWLACPVLLYWISRIWFLAQRDQMPHDPIVFALKDSISYAAGLILMIILILAT